jgi:hypothetical protein
MNRKTTFKTAYECALLGLPAAVRNDQCLHLGGPLVAVEREELDAHRIEGVAYLAGGEVADGALVASAAVRNLRLRNAARHQVANQSAEVDLVAADLDFWQVLAFGLRAGQRPPAYSRVVKTGKPFVEGLGGGVFSAGLDQHGLGHEDRASARNDVLFDERDAKAGDTFNMLSNPGLRGGASAHLDSAVAEVANVEVFHGSRLLLVSGAALWLFLPLAGGKNAVSDSVRELVRPLPYRLVSNANCLGGGGDGSAQQFNGLCFLHAHIEP